MDELKYCNACEHCHRVKIESTIYPDRCNFMCKYQGNNQMVEMVTQKGTLVKKPSWCPLDTPYKKITQEPKKKSAYEIKEALKAVKPITEWDDIEVNKIYHLPPLVEGDKRKDILITAKSQYYMSYKVLGGANSYSVNSFYPSSVEVKFLVPHKIMKFELVNGTTK